LLLLRCVQRRLSGVRTIHAIEEQTMRTRNLKLIGALALAVGSMSLQACSDDEALIGEWSNIESGVTESKYTFAEDGTFSQDELGDDNLLHPVYAGTFSTDGDRLTTEGQLGDLGVFRWETTYYADDHQFGRVALLPVGEVDGMVGTWHASLRLENLTEAGDSPETSDQTLTIAADGAVHLIVVEQGRSAEYDGVYVVDDRGRFELSLAGETGSYFSFLTPIDGAAFIDGEVYVR
jgi:hypothetical protein